MLSVHVFNLGWSLICILNEEISKSCMSACMQYQGYYEKIFPYITVAVAALGVKDGDIIQSSKHTITLVQFMLPT